MASFSAVHVLCMPLEAWVSFNTLLLHHELVFGLFDAHVWTKSLKHRRTWRTVVWMLFI